MHERESENHVLREEAKHLARLQDRMISLFDLEEEAHYESVTFALHTGPSILAMSSVTAPIGGLGSPSVSFTHYADDYVDMYYGGQLKILTDSFLHTNIHTDEIAREQVSDLLKQDETPKQYLGTYYFFNQQGDYAKTIILPSSIEDPRLSLSESQDFRVVLGEFKLSEVEFVGFILNDLYKKTKVALEELNS